MRFVKLFFHAHLRLIIAMMIGMIVWMLLIDGSHITRSLIAWNAGVWTYLAMVWWMMCRASPRLVKRRAALEDENATILLSLICLAAVTSMVALVMGLAQAKDFVSGQKEIRYLFTVLTVLGSWFLLGTMYALHYAHLFYNAAADKLPLRFPDDEKNPDYWDFIYFSFTMAVAVQTSDVSVMTRSMRKTVVMQSVLTFLFNSAILGLSINIAAGLVS
ncbi:MAG: DUF1345 domain-containing protein [Glaciimonas sp.]|nr:DUF1345 domain-containing protein [Glaciimonas sp.]